MQNDELTPRQRSARNGWIGSLAPLFVAVLLFDLPLGLLYGLRAELRHLSRPIPGLPTDVVSLVYSSDTMLPALSINTGPEDAISSRPPDAPKGHASAVAFVDALLVPRCVRYGSNAIAYAHGKFIPPPPRSYDPNGPPSA